MTTACALGWQTGFPVGLTKAVRSRESPRRIDGHRAVHAHGDRVVNGSRREPRPSVDCRPEQNQEENQCQRKRTKHTRPVDLCGSCGEVFSLLNHRNAGLLTVALSPDCDVARFDFDQSWNAPR
jgi:hypothetical protein